MKRKILFNLMIVEKMNRLILILSVLFLLNSAVHAQFTVTESFKGSALSGNIITGGSAILTSGNADPVNDGWLRLTPSSGNQKGYAYVNSSFPSTMGVIMEFEYKTWRSSTDSYNGADGFCVFLFDAATPTFATGGYGGSLGYAPNTGSGVTTGLSGGYLGVGFDEYGNFSNGNEGRVGGVGLKCNSITMRGPTTSSTTTTNRYLTSVQEQAVASNNTNSIDWNTVTTTRPADATFFRKVKITILPTGTGSYIITVYWQTSTSGSYTQLLQYTTTDVPPANLKLGFAASTGGGFNYHEIRNLYITTLGNVRVQKDVDKVNANVGDQVTYTVNVTNDNAAALNGVALADTLKNSAGSFLTLGSDFNINSITFNNNGNVGTTATGFTSSISKTSGFTNPWNTTLNIAANSVASFTIVGTVRSLDGNLVKNFVGIDPTASGITDQDLTNNYANVSTMVLNPDIDFTINKSVDNACADPVNGNTYSIVVSNMGASASDGSKTVTVTDVIPAGCTVLNTTGTGTDWTKSNSGNTYTFTVKKSLLSAYSYLPIIIKVKPPTTGTSWVNTATVAYTGAETNTSNNSSSVTIYGLPTLVVNNPAAVCSPSTVDLTAAAVTSGSDANLSFAYYTDATGTSVLSNPQAVSASGTYYIKGTNANGCSSAIKPVTVTINTQPTSPTAGDVTVCFDGSVHTASATAPTGTSIVWYSDATGTTASSAPSASIVDAYTAYAASKDNTTGCESSTRTKVVLTINALPTPPTAGDVTVCFDGSVHTASATAPTGMSIVWYSDATGTTASSAPSTSVVGTYTAYAASKDNTTGCESSTRTKVVLTINSTPTLTVTPAQTICSGAKATLAASGANLGTVTWSSDYYTISGTGTSITSNTLTNKGTALLVVRINAVADNGNCTATAITTVTIKPEPRVIVEPGSLEVCSSETPHITLRSVLAGTTINWQLVKTTDNSVVNSGSDTDSIDLNGFGVMLSPEDYTLKVTGTKDGCTSTENATVTVN